MRVGRVWLYTDQLVSKQFGCSRGGLYFNGIWRERKIIPCPVSYCNHCVLNSITYGHPVHIIYDD